MENLPDYIKVVFALTTLLTVFFFYKAAAKSTRTFIVLIIWMVFQAIIGLSNFYTITDTIPPRFSLLIGPPLLFILGLFLSVKGKTWLDGLNLKTLIILHTIRVPVEIVLFLLYSHKAIPELMTFEGRNFDIFSGITAPFIYYYGFKNQHPNTKILLAWNVICLGFLVNIVLNAALSVPSAIQQFAFDQPNIGVLYFPFNWLPSVVVPPVLLSHLAAIRQLLPGASQKKTSENDWRLKDLPAG